MAQEETKKNRRGRKAEKLPRKRVRTHWQKIPKQVQPKPVEERRQVSAEDVAFYASKIMEEKLEEVHERAFDFNLGSHVDPVRFWGGGTLQEAQFN